ncbi:hypothetical protein WMY93_025782 [Mugilogobius chulae]|uniref:Transporter n=1 Tax=Mugilogobius chulae TaxID=88201 RepID=A0AAW0N0C7_9GOBI
MNGGVRRTRPCLVGRKKKSELFTTENRGTHAFKKLTGSKLFPPLKIGIMGVETVDGAPASDSEQNKAIPEREIKPRDKWANKTEFILAMAGEIIGLGNVWRFPYLCYRNGGGVFFIPYFVRGDCLEEDLPMAEGVGIASQVIVTYLNIYYIVVLAWGIFYLFNSFQNPLPWSTCDNWWNTENCQSKDNLLSTQNMFGNWSFLHNSTSSYNYEDFNTTSIEDHLSILTTSESEFFNNRLLRMNDPASDGKVLWDVALCLLAAWIICYFCIFKGVKSTGKVVYFTATFPYAMLIILFIRGVTLPGAGEGIKFYLFPDYSKLADPAVWNDAGTQVFFSYAVCQGVLTALGSYNKYNNNCYRDCFALCCLNSGTSIFAGFVVFSVLGFMAHELQVPLQDVASSGPVSLFVRPGAREILVLAIAVICFLLALPLVSGRGIFLFHIIDSFGVSGLTLLFIAICECIVIGWVYGADRFLHNIEDMIGYPPVPVLKYCWMFITPLICGVSLLHLRLIFLNTTVSYSSHYIFYNHKRGYFFDEELSSSYKAIAAFLLLTPMICIPLFVFRSLCYNNMNMTSPSSDLRQAQPHKPILTLCKCVIFAAQVKPNVNVPLERNEKLAMHEPDV